MHLLLRLFSGLHLRHELRNAIDQDILVMDGRQPAHARGRGFSDARGNFLVSDSPERPTPPRHPSPSSRTESEDHHKFSILTLCRRTSFTRLRERRLSHTNQLCYSSFEVCMSFVAVALASVVAWGVGFGGPLATDRLIVVLMDGAALVPRAAGLSGAPLSPRVSFVADLFMGWAMPPLTHSGPLIVEDGQLAREDVLTVKRLYRNAVAEPVSGVSGTNDELLDAPKQPNSVKSAPPDMTPYVRPAVPEDYAPGGQEAIPKRIITPSPQQDKHESCSSITNECSD